MSIEVFASALLTLAGGLLFDPENLQEADCTLGSNYTCYHYENMTIISRFNCEDSDFYDFGVIKAKNPVGKLDCLKSKLTEFDNYTFDYKYEKFQISRCIFPSSVLSSFLSSQKQIEYLFLEEVTLEHKSPFDFRQTIGMSSKKTSDWIKSRVTAYLFSGGPTTDILQEDIFSGLTNIKHISLVKSGLSSIKRGKFVDQRNMIELHLNDNKIKKIDKDAFANLISLEVLNLQNNKLKWISPWFTNIGNLRKLNVSRNGIEEIQESSAFKNLGKLKILDLSHNHLNYSEIKAFLHKNFSSNPADGIIPIAYLNLSYNKIGEIDTWDSYMEFVEVDLSHNHIHHFLIDTIRIVSQNTRIDLSHNMLNKIFINELESSINEHTTIKFDFHGNLIECDCGLKPLLKNNTITSVGQYKKITVDIDNSSTCYYPLALRKRPLKTLRSRMSPCECPSGCTCYLNRISRIQVVRCFNANMPLVLPKYALFFKVALQLSGESIDSFNSSMIKHNAQIVGLDLSGNSISDLSKIELPDKLMVLDLRRNSIVNVKEETVETLNQFHDTYLYVSDNPIACNCDNWPFISYLQDKGFRESLEVTCENGQTLDEISDDICYEYEYDDTYLILIFIFVIQILLALFCLIRKSGTEIGKNKKYDTYLSHAPQDFNYVLREIMPMLQGKGLRVVGDDRYFSRGEQTANWLSKCDTIVVVISPVFIDTIWFNRELKVLLTNLVRDRPADVTMVRCEGEMDHPGLVKCGGTIKDPEYSLNLGLRSVRCYRLTDLEFLDRLPKGKGRGKIKYLRNDEAVQFS